MVIPRPSNWRVEELEDHIRRIKAGLWSQRAAQEVRYLEKQIADFVDSPPPSDMAPKPVSPPRSKKLLLL